MNYSLIPNYFVSLKPLAINNLPTEVELGEDVSSETLLIVINATDPAADSISCILSSILPNTTNFRLDDYLNGSMYLIHFFKSRSITFCCKIYIRS